MSPPAAPPARRLALLALWCVSLLLAVQLTFFGVEVARLPTNGFVAYHAAARLLRQGAPVARFYDDDWFEAQVAAETPGVRDNYFNPPTAALLLLPLGGLPYGTARVIWTAFNLLVLVVAAGWLIRAAGLRGWLVPAFSIALLASQPLREELHQGQAYLLLLLLLTAAWCGYRSGRAGLLGASLGLALTLKLAGIFILPLLLAQRRWRALGWTAATGLTLALVSLPWIGLDAWWRFAGALLRLRAEPDLAVTAYQSLPGLIRHLTTGDAQWNPGPLLDAPLLGRALQVVVLLAALGVVAVVARRADGDLAFAVAVIVGVVASPLSLDYHYVLLFLPAAILLGRTSRNTPNSAWPLLAVLGLALILMGADLPIHSPRLRDGWPALLAYPKLYGALLMLTLALWASLRPGGACGEARADPAWL
ncbi:MAG TPA: glycosyltransferase family 87 protein [Thermomicrobiaceae bacterium]|nr:glycosyltransferase family 87 protein [Thermomicrobiaceae bacterium]